MPLSPQITITPVNLTYKSFDISAVSYTSSTATYTATGHTFSVDDIVQITGLAPDGYNGTYTITAKATNIFTVANTTNTALTDQAGNAYWTDPVEYEYNGGFGVVYTPNNNDVNSIVDTNATVAAAQAQANAAQATATAAQASAATAYATAVSANTAASTAQSTANGKNKVTYSTSAPGSTANTAGDIWYQYGTSGVNNGRVIAQYIGAGGSSWTSTTISGLVIANIDAASITTGTLSVGLGITTGSGTFTVDAVSGALYADSATIKGQVSATSGYFGTSTNGFSITSTGMIGVGGGVISGGIITTSTGSNAVVLDGPNNALGIKYGGTYAGWLVGIGSGAFMMHYGTSPSTTAYPRSQVSSTTASLAADGSNSLSITTSGNNMQGAMTFGSTVTMNGNVNLGTTTTSVYSDAIRSFTTGSAANVFINASTGIMARSTSSLRYKSDVLTQEIDSYSVLNLIPKSYVDKREFENNNNSAIGLERHLGLIAEEVAEIPNLSQFLVSYDELGRPDAVSYERIAVAFLPLLKDMNQRLTALEGK